MEIEATCGCVDFPDGRRVQRLRAKRSIKLPLTVRNESLAPLDRTVTIVGRESRSGSKVKAALPMHVSMFSPFVETHGKPLTFPSAARRSPSERAATMAFRIPLVAGASSVRIVPQVSWLRVRTRALDGSLSAILETDPGAPEGKFSASADLLYAIGSREAATTIGIEGEVVSDVQVTPAQPNFGAVPIGQSERIQVLVESRDALPLPLKAQADARFIRCSVEPVSRSKMLVGMVLRPLVPGNFSSQVRIFAGGKRVAGFNATGYVIGSNP